MERKYKVQRKTILVLGIICLLFVVVIAYFQVSINSAKANKLDEMNTKVAELTAERDALQQAFDAKDYKNTSGDMKDQVKALEKEKKALLATPAPTEEPTVEPTVEPTAEPAAEG